jgi:hypothetical protein
MVNVVENAVAERAQSNGHVVPLRFATGTDGPAAPGPAVSPGGPDR